MTAREWDGWHYGPDGQPSEGLIEGTAFQPSETQDHLDAWATPHPGNLADCRDCKAASTLPGGTR